MPRSKTNELRIIAENVSAEWKDEVQTNTISFDGGYTTEDKTIIVGGTLPLGPVEITIRPIAPKQSVPPHKEKKS